MKTLLIFILAAATINCYAQKPFNIQLKKQLDTILKTDQGIREFTDSETSEKRKDTLALFLNYPKEVLNKSGWRIMSKIDSINLEKIKPIISKYGYPGKTLVGEPENTAVFYVIQHSAKISTYYPLIEKAGKDGELAFKYVTMMLDRKLVHEKKEQVYGTQASGIMVNNTKTGKKELFQYILPIKDAKNVSKRRKEAGFESTVEENAKRMGFEYKEYTYKQIEEIIKQIETKPEN